ncbi:MAG: hypothetical protein ABDI20_08770 [Candidatus Bipolaricaulaceae bacterium]
MPLACTARPTPPARFWGILGALAAVHLTQGASPTLQAGTFRTVVLVSLVPAVLAVLSLALLAREPTPKKALVPSRACASPA